MASAYGAAAVAAAGLIRDQRLTPPDAWSRALAESGLSVSSQDKPCPMGTFLGLCEAGLIRGVPGCSPGTYTKSVKNKGYAVRAVEILRLATQRSIPSATMLWLDVLGGEWKDPNHQMDIVLALWDAGWIPR